MKVVLTGAGGFLGWHTRLRLHALTDHDVAAVDRSTWTRLPELVARADAVIHVAGVNRGDAADVESGNLELARDLAEAVTAAGHPARIVYANSVQDGNGTPYGLGKRGAREILEGAAASGGGRLVDVRLPNLFGEHGRPNYNSFVATFVAAVRDGHDPQVADRPVGLLHAQGAAQALIDGLATDAHRIDPAVTTVGVQQVLDLLHDFKRSYDQGEFPDLSSQFRIELFNTYRAALFPDHYPIALAPHTDPRGTFVETVRCRGGEGQTSFSTTVPGITRGEHYHLSKIERFAVISGRARMSLRRMFSDEIVDFDVCGDQPAAIDMPVGWVHNITNTGTEVLLTQFWSHELFRPDAPDTFPERVRPHPQES
ncbi:MAG: NAD-dependent epimerase/dehydratase family protein [Tetrasphaera sp.]